VPSHSNKLGLTYAGLRRWSVSRLRRRVSRGWTLGIEQDSPRPRRSVHRMRDDVPVAKADESQVVSPLTLRALKYIRMLETQGPTARSKNWPRS